MPTDPYRLSLLDKAFVPEGADVPDALARTVALAQLAEELGFHRYWFAEHHGMAMAGSTAPEALVAFVLARTSRIRVGSGGVMLQHYAPFKVAETFRLLAALAPGRVDLGVGRAPGGMPQATRALRANQEGARPDAFADKLDELEAFVVGNLPEDHRWAGALAAPEPVTPPARILLGASLESAETAAHLGWDYCYAGHFDGDPDRMARVFGRFADLTGRRPLLALVAFADSSEERARSLAKPLRLYRVRLANGQSVNLPDLAAAAEFARQSGATEYTADPIAPDVLAGTGEQIRDALDDLHDRLGVEEFVIDIPVADHAQRRGAMETLARAMQADRAIARVAA